MQKYDQNIMDRSSNKVGLLHETFQIGITFVVFVTNHSKSWQNNFNTFSNLVYLCKTDDLQNTFLIICYNNTCIKCTCLYRPVCFVRDF